MGGIKGRRNESRQAKDGEKRVKCMFGCCIPSASSVFHQIPFVNRYLPTEERKCSVCMLWKSARFVFYSICCLNVFKNKRIFCTRFCSRATSFSFSPFKNVNPEVFLSVLTSSVHRCVTPGFKLLRLFYVPFFLVCFALGVFFFSSLSVASAFSHIYCYHTTCNLSVKSVCCDFKHWRMSVSKRKCVC